MKVYVLGAGAVGTYLGDKLRGDATSIVYAPRRLDDVKRIDADLVIVAVKAYDTDEAIGAFGQSPYKLKSD